MARKKKPEEHSHGESWLVSYCDMISLLVTFFLMMMTFSSSSTDDIREVGIALISGGGGAFQDSRTLPMGEKIDREAVAGLANDLKAFLEQRGVDETSSIRRAKDGFSIGFDVDSSFERGSAVPPAALVANLRELAPVLARWSRLVVVEGFVEGDYLPSEKHPDVDSLGVARASAAAEILIASAGMPRSSLQIASHGTSRPRADEATEIGRASNRRVEIKILSLAPSKDLGGRGT